MLPLLIITFLLQVIFIGAEPLSFSARCIASLADQQAMQTTPVVPLRNAIETSAIDPFFGIYFLRYLFQLTPQDQLVTGFYSLYGTNALFGGAYPGSYLLLSPILGYKRHLWAGLYAEYILLPGIAHYTDNNASISANSFEIWNEIHLGYQIDFKLGMLSFYICPEAIVGFDIYKSNEPTSFSQIEQTNPAFHFPNLYVLPNIIIGIKL